MATSSLIRNDCRARPQQPDHLLPDHLALGITISVSAGKTLVIEGDPIDHYFRIVDGSVRLYKAVVDGRRQILDFLGPEDSFGLTGLSVHSYSAEAITDVVMVQYSKLRLEAAIEGQPELSRQLLHLACSELDRAQQRMLLLGRKSADERLASFILDLAKRQAGTDLRLVMSRQDIADYLGLTIETVSRLFTRFKRAGLIGLPDRHSVIVKDRPQLSALAEGALAA